MENDKTTVWMPKHEAEAFKKYNEDIKEQAKDIPWWFKAFLQFKAEKGDFDDMEPVIRHRILKTAYGK